MEIYLHYQIIHCITPSYYSSNRTVSVKIIVWYCKAFYKAEFNFDFNFHRLETFGVAVFIKNFRN